MWMDRLVCGIGVVSMTMRVESLESGIELSSEREKFGKGYWVFVNFFLVVFVIDWLLLFLLRPDFMICSKIFLIIRICTLFNRFFLLAICWTSWINL